MIRRLACVGAGGALVLVLVSLVVAGPTAHAVDPFPSGQTTFNFTATMHITLGGSAPGTPATIAFTGSMTGTSNGSGGLSFPKSKISIAPTTANVILTGVGVTASAATAFTGTVNTTTGKLTLSGQLQAALNLSVATPSIFPGDTNCVLGPFAVSLATDHAGGDPYTPHGDTATATATDTTFNVPAVQTTGTCPSAAVVNAGAPFPLVLSRSLGLELDIFPPGVEPPSTTTTTTAATTTTTVPPTIAPITTVPGSNLANTGSSDTPAMLFGAAFVLCGLALIRPGRRRTRGDIRLRRTYRR